MPYRIEKRSGDKPYKIIKPSGEVVGSSKTRKDAEASIRARYSGEKNGRR
jgi:hypothetical protein